MVNTLVIVVFASTLLILTYLSGLDTTCIPPAFISTKLLSIAISTDVSYLLEELPCPLTNAIDEKVSA